MAHIQKAKHSTHNTLTVKMQLVARNVGGVMYGGAAPWVKMVRSGLEPKGFFLCFSSMKHLLSIREAAVRIVRPRPLFVRN